MADDINVWMLVLCAAIAYLLGSIPFAYIFSKAFKGEDIRKKGSGNTGTANTLRNYGWGLGLLTLAGDILKGVLAAIIGLSIAGQNGLYIAAVFAVTGHNFSVYLKFKGGKGVATTTGVLLVIQPLPTVIIFSCCVLIVAITKIMSIGSIIGFIASAIVAFIISGGNIFWQLSVLIIVVMGIIGHRENIVRLIHGNERKLNFKKR